FLGGLGCMIAAASVAPHHPWTTAWFLALFSLAAASMIVGALALSHEWIGFPRRWPKTHAERMAERRNRTKSESKRPRGVSEADWLTSRMTGTELKRREPPQPADLAAALAGVVDDLAADDAELPRSAHSQDL